MPRSLQVITNRLGDVNVRRARFQGREHLVLPAVMLREQVLNCDGCDPAGEFVPATEIAASVGGWAGRPVTLGHPRQNGTPVSANSPTVLERHQVGWVFHPTVDGEALKAEAWIDVVATRRVLGGNRLMERLEEGEVLEVSTGYFRDAETKKGTYNNRSYGVVQTGIVPDHFAILLDEPGACSVQDGCGTPRVNAAGDSLSRQVRAVEEAVWARNRELGDDSFSDWWHPVETFDDAIVVQHGTQLLRVPYTVAEDGSVEFGTPEEVRVRYETVANSEGLIQRIARGLARLAGVEPAKDNAPPAGDHGGLTANHATPNRESTMDRTKVIAALAASEAVPFSAEQLEPMTDEQLQGLEKLAAPPEPAPKDEPAPAANKNCGCKDKGIQPANQDVQKAVANAVREALGFEPGELKGFMAAQKQEAAQAKAELVSKLAANERCPFAKDELETMALAQLRKLEGMLTPASYLGLGGPRGVANADDAPPAPPAVLLAAHTTNGKEA